MGQPYPTDWRYQSPTRWAERLARWGASHRRYRIRKHNGMWGGLCFHCPPTIINRDEQLVVTPVYVKAERYDHLLRILTIHDRDTHQGTS